MAEHSGKTITFGADLLPLDDDTYFLGNENKKWKIYGDVTGTISGYLPYKGNINALGNGSPHGTVKTWWESTTNVPRLSVLAAYNNYGAEKTLIFSKGDADKTYGTVLAWGYTDKYIRILRKNSSSSWLSSDWEKIDAGYADSAGTATTATNLASNPSIQISGTTQVTITAGEKTSDAFTVPYATSAGSIAWANVSGKPIDFSAYSGALNTNGWKTLGGCTSGAKIAIAYNNSNASWNSGKYSASIVFGCSDTKGLLDCSYNNSIVTFGGGSVGSSTNDNPVWYFKLSATSGQTYTFPATSKTLAASDGSNASGTNWAISITGKAGSVDWANTGHPTTFPPSTHDHDSRYALKEHAHGNITSDGKMSGSTVSGAVTTTHKFLREDGTWVVPKYTTNTHYTTKLIAGGSAATSNAAVTSGNVYLRLFDDSTHRNNIQFAAGSNMTITSDASGIITFKSSYTNNAATHTPSQVIKYYLTGTTSSTTTTSGDTYDIDLYTTTTPGELSALRYSLHYGSIEKAHLVYNNTDDSIDFVFV